MLHVAEPEAAYEAYSELQRQKEAIEAAKERERIKQEEERILHSKKQGEFTLEDYHALPDGVRYELIDCVLFKMEAPTRDHQDAAGLLYLQLSLCVMQHHMSCHPYISPIDVQLDCDDRTMLQPDVIVVCDQEGNHEKHIVGAPEFAAEVLSPSTRKKDIFIKLRKYQEAGVKECWLIDPERQQVTVWLFYKGDASKGYSFDDHIPVSISDGKCEICFHELMKQMNFNKG
jgi:Uma2 family endonuclease